MCACLVWLCVSVIVCFWYVCERVCVYFSVCLCVSVCELVCLLVYVCVVCVGCAVCVTGGVRFGVLRVF